MGEEFSSPRLGSVASKIVEVLKEENKALSTYELAKRLGVSWSTVNTHCYKLKDRGVIKGQEVVSEISTFRKVMWWLEGDQ